MTADTAGPAATVCFACGEPIGATDSFCESCGAELAPLAVSDGRGGGSPVCESCSSSRISPDGYCESCGRKVRSGRDHQETDLGIVAGVTDRGLRHHRNEDAMALGTADTAAGPVVVAVVCDGVSSSAQPDEASLGAARAAAGVLLAAVRTGRDLLEAAPAAVRAAAEAVTGLGRPDGPLADAALVHLRLRGPDQRGRHRVLARRQPRLLAGHRSWFRRPAAHHRRLGGPASWSRPGCSAEADALASAQGHVMTALDRRGRSPTRNHT